MSANFFPHSAAGHFYFAPPNIIKESCSLRAMRFGV